MDARLTARLKLAANTGWQHTLLALVAHSGDSWFMIPAMMIVWLAGDNMWKWRMLVMFLAMCITGFTAVLLKRLIGRRRPEGEWGLVYRSTDPHSFPSGHAARLFTLAVLSIHLGSAGLLAGMLVWAILVAYARIAMGVHYISDVLGGILYGSLLGGVWLLFL